MGLLHATSIPESLYLHYPLCQHVCSYCDFNVYRSKNHPDFNARWIEKFEAHLKKWLPESSKAPLRTLYLGGGTPSLLRPTELHDLSKKLQTFYDLENLEEWTVEANPESLNQDFLQSFKNLGGSRVSLGVQSFRANILKRLERLATCSHIESGLSKVKDLGLQLNIDLMFGLPDQGLKDFSDDLEMALQFDPDHLSVYLLTLQPGHPWLKSKFLQKRWASETLVEEMYQHLCARTSEAGFLHYEVSNFAKPGRESLHNKNYWDPSSSYLALGPGAHAYWRENDRPVRSWNCRSISDWLSSEDGVDERENLDEEQQKLESLYLNFRTRSWLKVDAAWPQALLQEMEREQLIERRDDEIRMTEGRWILIDAVVGRLVRSV